MAHLSYSDLISMDLGKLGTAASDWKTMAGELAKLATDVRDGLVKKSDGAHWQGANATVTKDFVRKTAKEFTDLHAEALSIASVLTDAHSELTHYQHRAKNLTESAGKGDPSRQPPDPAFIVTDGPNGTVKVMEAMCTPEGPNQRTRDRLQWYADTLTGIVTHAAEVDAAAQRALRKSHGNDLHNAGHAKYTSLDEEQLPRAMKLAGLGEDANPKQRAELRRLWESLSPGARGQLWLAHKDDLMAAGIMSTTAQRVAMDAGAGKYDSESAGFDEWATKRKMELLVQGADMQGMTDAARHMSHYLGNTGNEMKLPVDKMMEDVPEFNHYIEDIVRHHQGDWRTEALEEFKRNGGKPVALPVQVKAERGFYFSEDLDPNWYFAVGGTNSNVTGVVTAVPDANGNPKISVDYQANVWDRYNWDEGKGVDVGPLKIPDGDMAKLHRAGEAQEFDMRGSSTVKHYDLGTSAPNSDPLPGPEHDRADDRLDPGREQQDRTGLSDGWAGDR
ncbi:hypothetical protein [Streptomyces sp. NPDC046821]|uniref:hypothetical protein n=1 Tax=Streptomyces sp. NPDC046821 TaxID=3154702 RepID=UPI0033D35CD2